MRGSSGAMSGRSGRNSTSAASAFARKPASVATTAEWPRRCSSTASARYGWRSPSDPQVVRTMRAKSSEGRVLQVPGRVHLIRVRDREDLVVVVEIPADDGADRLLVVDH